MTGRVSAIFSQEDGEALHQASAGRLGGHASRGDRGAAQQSGKVVDEAAAEGPHLAGREPAEVALERLRPQPERNRRSERVSPGPQTGDTARRSRQQVVGQPRLAHAGIAAHQHRPERAGGRPGELRPQRLKLGLPSDASPAHLDPASLHRRIMGQARQGEQKTFTTWPRVRTAYGCGRGLGARTVA